MSLSFPWRAISQYLSAKLFGAGVGLLVFIFIFNGFHFLQWSGKRLFIPFGFFYGYGLLFSFVADFLVRLVRHGRPFVYLVMYIFGGFLPFLWGDIGFGMIAGTIGAFFSLIVLVAAILIEERWPYSAVGAAALLLFYLGLFVCGTT
ncbi:hypothetical protein [Paenibacillus glycanilyticus]|uniref:Uncharacterized protein n=1 Tax=Paenibacillus glycanilyticus TaxID=126569 RepID=A0ABQ6GHI1_9BACL|nr:hypothetical protein [Paenibacillus glycanilyticus]GLX68793.1 hypothetical protein MU1_31380 [Paenibacillus glycanilyticus]